MQVGTRRLSNLLKGESAIIDSFNDEVIKQKLLEMGCLPGETITIDGLHIGPRVKGFELV